MASVTAAGASTTETSKFLAANADARDQFGEAVDVSRNIIVVGAVGDDDTGVDYGAAYLFDITTGMQAGKLFPSEPVDSRFGFSVAINSTHALVGAPFDGDNGAAYLFDLTTGHQTAKLLPGDGTPPQRGSSGDQFGFSVALDEGRAIVGAPRNNFGTGAAYLFDIASGQEIGKLVSENPAVDFFGWSVGVSGDSAIVGAERSESAFLFDTTTGQQYAELIPEDKAFEDGFGSSVAILGSTAIVGAPLGNAGGDAGGNAGAAYLFDTSTGMQISKLIPHDLEGDDRFGNAVAISEIGVVVGAYLEDENGLGSGSAYLFDYSSGEQVAKFVASDGAMSDRFGSSVGISEIGAVVGAPGNRDSGENSGSAYFFELAAAATAGDYDGSGQVEQGDLNLVLSNWGKDRGRWGGATGFDTELVDQEELNRVLNNWGSSNAPSFAGFDVPEPAGFAALAGFAFCGTRRHGRAAS
ncbi:MAG: hypothetical protein AAGJ38_01010 [Planctomycetota bacterium]